MNTLKSRLIDGDCITAAWAQLASPDVAEIMVHHGCDVIVIDGEHGRGTIEDWVNVARAVEAAGGSVVLRIPDGSDTMIKQVLDRGFRALIVPMVNSVAQAQSIAQSCQYPSRGTRGYAASLVRASGYGARADYASRAHQELLLFVQCEHPDAVTALPDIAAIPGIDGIFLGPNDLANAMGHLEDLTHPTVQSSIADIESKAAASGTILGSITGAGRGWGDLSRLGYQLIIGGSDVAWISGATRQYVAERDADMP